MITRGFRETMAGSSKLLWPVFRHIILAPLVSFYGSFVSFFLGIFPIVLFGRSLGGLMCFILIGFSGVFSGACCLPQRNRGLGAICLTALGMIFYSDFAAEWGDMVTDEGKFIDAHNKSLLELTLLGCGGLLAIALICWTSSVMLHRLLREASVLTFRSHHFIRRG